MKIAIQPDNYGPGDASSPLWTRFLLEAGHQVKEVTVFSADVLDQLKGCDAFMWRWAHFSGMGRVARRLLPVIEKCLKIPVYPNQNTCWHYDDKIAQCYLLELFEIPAPKTWIWYNHTASREWASSAHYPLVLKLAAGAGSANVIRVNNFKEALFWIDRLFNLRLTSLNLMQFEPYGVKQRLDNIKNMILHGDKPVFYDDGYDAQSGYVYFQEFLPDNSFDTRVTVIGDRAFAFRRFNRENDFRASGSGMIDYDQEMIDKRFISLAFDTSKKLGMQSCAIDGLFRGNVPVISEISYTFTSRAVYDCPGYWDPDLVWHDGNMWPEEAQILDFMDHLKQSEPRK